MHPPVHVISLEIFDVARNYILRCPGHPHSAQYILACPSMILQSFLVGFIQRQLY
jgi:hypothetical protein